MLFQVCDPPETIGIGIIQPDETKTYIKKQENARGFSMDKLTKLPTSPISLYISFLFNKLIWSDKSSFGG